MGIFDQAARFAAQGDPVVVVTRVLASTRVRLRFLEWADTRTMTRPGGTDRTADLVAILEDADAVTQPWLLVVEFQAQHDPDKLDVTLQEAAHFRVYGRHGPERRSKFRVLVGLVYLQGECPQASLDMTLPEGFGTLHKALVWNVAMDSAEEALAAVETGQASWGLLFWVPLMVGGGDPEVIARWKACVLALTDRRQRGDLASIALVFAELAGWYAAWETALEEIDMTESKVVNRWIEQAVERKQLDGARQFLLRLLNNRFPNEVPPEVVETINAQPSLAMLKDWFDHASQVGALADFIQVLRR